MTSMRRLFHTSERIVFDVAAHGGTTIGEAAERLGISPAQVNTTLRRLRAGGLVERLDKRRSGRGNEVWIWRLTEAGKQELLRLRDGVLWATKEMDAIDRESLPDMPGVRPERRHSLSELRRRRLE